MSRRFYSPTPNPAPAPGRNLLINGSMRVVQRADVVATPAFDSTTTFPNSDGTYLLDRWVLLSDGDDRVDVTQETDAPTGFARSAQLEGETLTAAPNSEKFGMLQVLEEVDAKRIIGGSCSLSFYAKTASGQIENLRAGVLAWSSTADAVTLDVVNTWGAEGSNPTLVANWMFENTPEDLALSDSWKRFEIPGIAVDTANTENVAVLIWVDDTDVAAGDVVLISGVQLEPGVSVTEYEHIPVSSELERCYRFFRRYGGAGGQPRNHVVMPTSGDHHYSWAMVPEMRSSPSVTLRNAAGWSLTGISAGEFSFEADSKFCTFRVDQTGTSGSSIGCHPDSADDLVDIDAEL